MEKGADGKDVVCEALCHQEASLPLRREHAGRSSTSDVAKFHCKVCEKGYNGQHGRRLLIPQPQMRAHIATHILRGHIKMGAAGICGYCGERENPCVVSLVNGQSSKIKKAKIFAKSVTDGKIVYLDSGAKHISTCPCHYSFKLSSAKNADAKRNCSNIPMTCAACFINGNKNTVIWKYAMHQHYVKHHPDKELPDESTVDEGEAHRLWHSSLHPGDIAPQRPYQEPPEPPLPWTFKMQAGSTE